MALSSYRELQVWQRGMDLAVECYILTRDWPKQEMFGLTGQVRRSACAISANIAEGYGRGHRKEYVQFLRIAAGSLNELETHLILAARVGIVSEAAVAPCLAECREVGRMLVRLIASLEKPKIPPAS